MKNLPEWQQRLNRIAKAAGHGPVVVPRGDLKAAMEALARKDGKTDVLPRARVRPA